MIQIVSLALALALTTSAHAAAPKAPEASFEIEGLRVNVVMQAPHLMVAPLQVFGAFRYQEKGDGFSGADLEMDEGFGGLIQTLRKEHAFGDLGETLLLNAPKKSIVVPAKVLVMGLGDPEKFKPEDMGRVGRADVRAVCGLGLREFSHASDVQDGGVTSFSAGVIAQEVVRGILGELRTQKRLAERKVAAPCNLKVMSYLAGPKYLEDTVANLGHLATELGGKRLK